MVFYNELTCGRHVYFTRKESVVESFCVPELKDAGE